jgi:phosphoenolpyruvate phosphomutase
VNRADRKRRALRTGLQATSPVVAVGAHDAMTACLIERHGFDAVWVSGLGVATMTHAIPDLNLVTMTEALAAARRADAATSLPVIADCDNGFGSLSNVVRTVREYERAGIAAICVEDNLFPKRNSLYAGDTKRDLIPPREQAARIRAAKMTQETNDFLFIARIESLIAGTGVDDACLRADAYVDAGADAILIHSRDKTLSDIERFLDRWEGRDAIPLVSVPTLYPSFTVEELGSRGFRMVIFANHPMRAAVTAIERTLETLGRERRASAADPEIAPVDHIFQLVGTKDAIELEDASEDG